MTTTSMSDILEKIAGADTDELNEIVQMIKVRRQHLAHKAKLGLRVGDRVQFKISGKRRWDLNGTWEGTVKRVMQKNLRVSAVNTYRDGYPMSWTVPVTMVEKVK